MANTPKPEPHDSGQVRSLTQRRAEKEGTFKPTIYDVSYVKGERIMCSDPYVAYLVRAGSVRAKKEMDTQSGRNLVTVDFVEQGEPLLVSRFIPNVKDDRDIQFYAETDCIIGEFPIHSISAMFDAREFLRSFSQSSAEHTQRLREALYKQLERNQKSIEENRGLKMQLAELQRQQSVPADMTDEVIGLQIQTGDLRRELEEAKKAQTKAEKDAERARVDLKVVREREKNAIAKAREAFDYFQSLEQRQREESMQFPDMVNRILGQLGLDPLPIEDMMFLITTTTSSENTPLETGSYDLEVVEEPPQLDDSLPSARPRMETISFEEGLIPTRESGHGSGYSLTGDQIAQDGAILLLEEDDGDRHTPTVPPPDAILARIETKAVAQWPAKPAPLAFTGRAPRPNAPAPQPQAPLPPSAERFELDEPPTERIPVSCPAVQTEDELDAVFSTTANWDVRDPLNPKPMK